ncbi:ARM repeat-containing protein [Rhodotorula sp. JG-1b]|nr:ARM repeat-containing protein [Rhodotorula sp. JG-1b]
MFSSFSPDPAADQGSEESAIGKMVAMSLIAAITSADCLDSSVLVEQFLPEVVRMGDEPMFYVRKEAVQALGALAKAMPLDVLQSTVLTLHETFSKDPQWLVRRAAVLAVPSICARLPRATLRTVAVRAVSQFAEDEDRNVRSGALEICGELIYLFHEDPDGQLASPRDGDDSPPNPFSPLQNSLDSPSTSFLDSVKTWSPIRPWPASRDPEREILTAFNFPAVVLTLGRSQWSRLANHHRELCGDPVEKVRQSLASSLHEVAKIIGPEQSDASLLDPFGWFVVDVDNVQGPVLDNLPSLLRSFTDEGAATALRVLGEGWNQIRLWRQRERVAQQFADFGVDLVRRGRVDAVLELLVRACKDSVAAVREAAVQSVRPPDVVHRGS